MKRDSKLVLGILLMLISGCTISDRSIQPTSNTAEQSNHSSTSTYKVYYYSVPGMECEMRPSYMVEFGQVYDNKPYEDWSTPILSSGINFGNYDDISLSEKCTLPDGRILIMLRVFEAERDIASDKFMVLNQDMTKAADITSLWGADYSPTAFSNGILTIRMQGHGEPEVFKQYRVPEF